MLSERVDCSANEDEEVRPTQRPQNTDITCQTCNAMLMRRGGRGGLRLGLLLAPGPDGGDGAERPEYLWTGREGARGRCSQVH